MNLADWLARLETFSPAEIVLGLERVHTVWERLALAPPATVLTIAGTNGKGSSVAMTAALLTEGGMLVGAYSSPHVIEFNERIAVAGQPATDEEIVAAFERIETVRGATPLTYFEYGTLAAMLVFATRGVDVAVLEVGMGGRLDAVNAFEPAAGLITNIALDHCAWLGNDVETIAVEKAGIMRRGKPIVFGAASAPLAIGRMATAIGAELVQAGRDFSWQSTGANWSWQGRAHHLTDLALPALPGATQVSNAAGVLAMLEAAGYTGILQKELIDRALSGLALSGRMQLIVSDRHWLLDVAHNPAAAQVLASTLAGDDFDGATIAILAMLDDKDVAACVAALAPCVDRWIAVTADSKRAIPAAELARQVANVVNKACLETDTIEQAMTAARAFTSSTDRILVTGSFYVVGPALKAIGYNRRASKQTSPTWKEH
ncbi:MAG TPA: folylpolyglutamate synthase/dihydrofolate synthase family protein [Woeseiaceae bacterium]|nr:folylpolyglutamate synthase/dihydrofolate synthase family protein [Woeseiaceae bacterium]